MQRVFGIVSLWSATLLLAACSGETTDTAPSSMNGNLWLPCAESRGALFEFSTMQRGQQPVDTSTVSHGGTWMRVLAKEVSPPATVTADIHAWEAAGQHWLDALRAIPPRIEDGRFVEPDTTALDRRLVEELEPIGKRLGEWVESACPEL